MPRVVQIRDVPDDVHEALTKAARAHGLSLTRYMLRQMEDLARRDEIVRHNAAVVVTTRQHVGRSVDRDAILSALHEDRHG